MDSVESVADCETETESESESESETESNQKPIQSLSRILQGSL